MVDFTKKQAEMMRQEKWKYFEEKIKLEIDKYYNFWRRHFFAGEDSGDLTLADY